MREIVNTEVNQLTFEKLTEFKRQFSNEEIVEEEKQNVYNNQQKESEQNRKMNELLQKMAKLELENQKLKEKEES
jgi:glutaminase